MNLQVLSKAAEGLKKIMEESGATSARFVFREEDGTPTGMLLLVDGELETAEILTAIEKVEEKW